MVTERGGWFWLGRGCPRSFSVDGVEGAQSENPLGKSGRWKERHPKIVGKHKKAEKPKMYQGTKIGNSWSWGFGGKQ